MNKEIPAAWIQIGVIPRSFRDLNSAKIVAPDCKLRWKLGTQRNVLKKKPCCCQLRVQNRTELLCCCCYSDFKLGGFT